MNENIHVADSDYRRRACIYPFTKQYSIYIYVYKPLQSIGILDLNFAVGKVALSISRKSVLN